MEDPFLEFLPHFWSPSKLISHYRECLTRRTSPPPATVDPTAAALEIQKACRGFLVRRRVGAVRRLESEVFEIEREAESSLDLALGDEREKIRLGEMLMGVLFRLDSVRGAREYRRKVIRQAIRLQEALDSVSEEVKRSKEDAGAEAEEGSVPAGGGAEEGVPVVSAAAVELAGWAEENGSTTVVVEEEDEKESVVMEEEEGLRRMVAELTERNAALTTRVEELERRLEELARKKGQDD